MCTNRKNEGGFSQVEVILVLIVVALVIAMGWLVYKNHNRSMSDNAASSSTVTKTPAPATNSTPRQAAPASTSIKTKDGHVQFTIPANWKVVSRVDGGKYCGFAGAQATQGNCLTDATYQPTSFNSDGQTFWDTKVFQTTKSPQTWNADVNGTGQGACDNPVEKTLNGYQELVCKDSAGGTSYIISNGQYLADFGDSGSATGSFANAAALKYEPDVQTVVNSIKFN